MTLGADADVLVVGAGPAGASAAVHSARAGLRTLLVDRAVFPRDKCCGDGLTTLALRELEALGLQPEAVSSWHRVDAATVRSPSGRELIFPLPQDSGCYAAVARRADLDNALITLARAAGAEVADGHALRSAAGVEGGGAIRAQVEGLGPLTARWVVGADGMWSPLRRSLGLAPTGYRGEWHAFRQYFRSVGPRAAELAVWFEADLLPGYAWSFPLGGGRANVGFGIQRGGRHGVGSMNRLWRDLLARPHVSAFLGPEAEPERRHRAWPIPARVGRLPLAAGRVLFAGDAAGVSDPATGEGIGQALLTGRLAAEAIISAASNAETVSGSEYAADAPSAAEAVADAPSAAETVADAAFAAETVTDAAFGTEYERRVRAELAADDRMSRVLIPLLARPSIARAGLRLAGATDWTRRNFARWLFEDYPRALIATPRRWRRSALTAQGAFASSAPSP